MKLLQDCFKLRILRLESIAQKSSFPFSTSLLWAGEGEGIGERGALGRSRLFLTLRMFSSAMNVGGKNNQHRAKLTMAK